MNQDDRIAATSASPQPSSKSSAGAGSSTPLSVGSFSKETEIRSTRANEPVSEINTEVNLPKEVEQAGVFKHQETIELPPDIKKMGVSVSGASTPVPQTPLPTVTLPISDTQVVVGLHAQVTQAIRWLAVWCIRRLKKAHIALKTIHGKIVRVPA